MQKDYSDMKERIEYQLKKYNNVQGIMQYINIETLKEQHNKQKGNKATGIDKITKEQYAEHLEENLEQTINKMKQHKYKPKAVRRVLIPKPNGKMRPLGIPSYEDKLIQAQMADILNIIFERYFKDFSYGFRPNRDCHQAIRALDKIIMHGKVNHIVEADIKGFFDHVNHEILIKMLEVVIDDRDFVELVRKFLKAGYVYNEELVQTNEGTPQGGIISPILANLYLHVVLDNWFDNEIRKLCKGEVYIIRYADDFVCLFQNESDAKMFYEMLPKRFAQFDLEVEPTKTKIFPFGRYAKEQYSFDFLGFKISNGISRNGYYMVNYKTSEKKSKQEYLKLTEFIKVNRTTKPKDLIKAINRKLTGIFNYYGITGNYKWMIKFWYDVKQLIRKWLSRRSQKGKLSWDKFNKIIENNSIVMPKITLKLW